MFWKYVISDHLDCIQSRSRILVSQRNELWWCNIYWDALKTKTHTSLSWHDLWNFACKQKQIFVYVCYSEWWESLLFLEFWTIWLSHQSWYFGSQMALYLLPLCPFLYFRQKTTVKNLCTGSGFTAHTGTPGHSQKTKENMFVLLFVEQMGKWIPTSGLHCINTGIFLFVCFFKRRQGICTKTGNQSRSQFVEDYTLNIWVPALKTAAWIYIVNGQCRRSF